MNEQIDKRHERADGVTNPVRRGGRNLWGIALTIPFILFLPNIMQMDSVFLKPLIIVLVGTYVIYQIIYTFLLIIGIDLTKTQKAREFCKIQQRAIDTLLEQHSGEEHKQLRKQYERISKLFDFDRRMKILIGYLFLFNLVAIYFLLK